MNTLIDLTGMRFGSLVVREKLPPTGDARTRWLCDCDCGNSCIAFSYSLRKGKQVSCGCAKTQDLTGQRFGMLTVLKRSDRFLEYPSGGRGLLWECRCDCGKEHTVLGYNLTRGTTVSCGCKRYRNLEGQRIGKLTVIGRSDKYGSRGKRKTRLWECRCDCGAITYKATDTLTNPDVSMCQDCASKYAASKARASAGYIGGTQISKITCTTQATDSITGIRGVYYDGKSGKYRARIKFKGKIYNLGSFTSKEDAIKARQKGEEDLFGSFLESYKMNK